MTDNTRHLPGSTQSRRTPLSPFLLHSSLSTLHLRNRSKTSPKSVRLGICEFFTYSAPTSYNFDTQKRSDFPVRLASLAVDNQSPDTESHGSRPGKPVACHPFSLREKVRMRDKPVIAFRSHPADKKFINTVQNETKRDELHILKKWTTPYQRLTTTPFPVVPFWTLELLWGLEIGAWGFGGKLCHSYATFPGGNDPNFRKKIGIFRNSEYTLAPDRSVHSWSRGIPSPWGRGSG